MDFKDSLKDIKKELAKQQNVASEQKEATEDLATKENRLFEEFMEYINDKEAKL